MKCTITIIKNLTKKPLLFTLILFVLAVLFVGVQGEFPINDDWIFVRQLEGFRVLDSWTINAAIDPSFIFQGLLGHGWSALFGISFESLRVLTIIFTLGILLVMSALMKRLDISPSVTLAILLLTAFNPIVFSSAFSFMTENYYLFFYLISILSFLVHFKEDKIFPLILGLVFAGLALLIRQLAVVLFIAYLLTALYYKKLTFRNAFLFFLVGGFFFYTYAMWPRYLDGDIATSYEGLLSNLLDQSDKYARLMDMVWVLPYFAFYLLPLAFFSPKAVFKKHKLIVKLLAVVGFYFLANWLFVHDVFSLGSVLYLEGLHGKSNFRSHFSLFNNVPFKSLLATLISLASIRLVLFYNQMKKLDFTSTFLLLTALGSFAILLFGNDLYERYAIPAFFSTALFFVYYFKDSIAFGTKFQWTTLILLIVISVLLQQDSMAHTRLRWSQALALQDDTGYVNSIFVDGTYKKHFAAQVRVDYTGFDSGDPSGDTKCYVQKYYLENDTAYFRFMSGIDEWSRGFIENPEIVGAKRDRTVPSIKKHFDEVLYNEEYISPLYNLVGKKAHVGSWCTIN